MSKARLRSGFLPKYIDEYALRITKTDPNTGEVLEAACMLCENFGREHRQIDEEQDTDQKKRRKRTANVKYFKAFRVDGFGRHLETQHPIKWQQYKKVRSNKALRQQFLFQLEHEPPQHDETTAPTFVDSTDLEQNGDHFGVPSFAGDLFPIKSNAKMVLYFGFPVVEHIIADLHGGYEDEQDIQSIFIKSGADSDTGSEQYMVEIDRKTHFQLVRKLLKSGLSFIQCVQTISSVRHDLGSTPRERMITPSDVASLAKIICAMSFQGLSDLLRRSWAYSIVLDVGKTLSEAYLDIKVRVYTPSEEKISNFHVIAITRPGLRAAKDVFDAVDRTMMALDPQYRNKLISVISDCARSVSESCRPLAGRLADCATNTTYRTWFGVHRFNNIIKNVVFELSNHDEFLSGLTKFVGWLRNQSELVERIGYKCPHYNDAKWSSLGNIAKWILEHRRSIINYIDERRDTAGDHFLPLPKWWVMLYMIDAYMQHVSRTFDRILGKSFLVSEQYDQLHQLINALRQRFLSEVIIRPTGDPIDPTDMMIHFEETPISVKKYIGVLRGLDLHCYDYVDSLDLSEALNVAKASIKALVDTIMEVKKILHDKAHSEGSGEYKFPVVLPLPIAHLSGQQFMELLRVHQSRFCSLHSENKLDLVGKQYNELRLAVNSEPTLENELVVCGTTLQDGVPTVSFEKAWAPIVHRFPDLVEFAGGLASVFPGVPDTEEDFAVVSYDKDGYPGNLTNLSLESILHAKQYDTIDRLRVAMNA